MTDLANATTTVQLAGDKIDNLITDLQTFPTAIRVELDAKKAEIDLYRIEISDEIQAEVAAVRLLAQVNQGYGLDNSQFLIDQRENGSAATTGFARDRWQAATLATVSVANEANGTITITGKLKQILERNIWVNKKVTISVTDLDTDLLVYCGQNNVGTIINGSGVRSVTITGAEGVGVGSRSFYIEPKNGGSANFKDFTFDIGEVRTAFKPAHPQDDLARCQRHFEAGKFRGCWNAYSGGFAFWEYVSFKVQKSVKPTMVLEIKEMRNSSGGALSPSSYTLVLADYLGSQSALNEKGFVPYSADGVFTNNTIGYGYYEWSAATGL